MFEVAHGVFAGEELQPVLLFQRGVVASLFGEGVYAERLVQLYVLMHHGAALRRALKDVLRDVLVLVGEHAVDERARDALERLARERVEVGVPLLVEQHGDFGECCHIPSSFVRADSAPVNALLPCSIG